MLVNYREYGRRKEERRRKKIRRKEEERKKSKKKRGGSKNNLLRTPSVVCMKQKEREENEFREANRGETKQYGDSREGFTIIVLGLTLLMTSLTSSALFLDTCAVPITYTSVLVQEREERQKD